MLKPFLLSLTFLFVSLTAARTIAQTPASPSAGSLANERGVRADTGKKYIYKRVNGQDLALYVMSPHGPGPSPAIIFIHGGSWTMGGPSAFNKQAEYLQQRGMVAIQIEYRLLSKTDTLPPEVCVQDSKSAIRWVRAHTKELGIDPGKIVLAGGSAGGYLAAFDSMVPGWDDPTDDLKISTNGDALVLFNPVIDNTPAGFGYQRFGETYKQYSPYFFVTAKTPPTLIMSGSDDKLVHPPMLQAYKSMMEKAGVRCDLVLYPGGEHGFFNSEPYLTQTEQAMAAFLASLHYIAAEPAP